MGLNILGIRDFMGLNILGIRDLLVRNLRQGLNLGVEVGRLEVDVEPGLRPVRGVE